MKKTWLLAAITLGITGVIFILYFLLVPANKRYSVSPAFNTNFAYDNATFLSAVSKNKATNHTTIPKAVIVPHHLLASSLIADGISLFVGNGSPKTLILFSPNHNNTGACDIITSPQPWNTPFGEISIDTAIEAELIKTGAICEDNLSLVPEHGIAGLLPFIKYYLPNTKIVPLAIKKNPNPDHLDSLISILSRYSARDVAFLGSIDFSHYLTSTESKKRDDQTLKLIQSKSYLDISKLSTDNIDSPPALIVMMKILDAFELSFSVLNHANATDFNNSENNVTSYFVLNSYFPNETNTFSLLAGGDVMLGRTVGTRMLKNKDYSWPFQKIAGTLSSADLTLVNLESPFKKDCQPRDTGMIFCSQIESVSGLKNAGIDVVTIANNHINNQGFSGINDTLSTIKEANIGVVGMGLPYTVKIKNTKIAFLGFNDIGASTNGISAATENNIKTQISQAKKENDMVIATFHWGNEYSLKSSRQTHFGHLAIDSGADVVIGHHPHWIQEEEVYKGKPIYYSLGNLVFDQMWSQKTSEGLLVKLTFEGNKLIDQKKLYLDILDYGQPTLRK